MATRSLLFALAPLAFLWLNLIDQLRVEWAVNPQYSYGFAVPFLCVYLLRRRFVGAGSWKLEVRNSHARPGSRTTSAILSAILALCALLLAPTLLIQEANPEWRLVSWLLAGEVGGLTLVLLRFWKLGNQPNSWWFAFPILFFMVAVPWPTVIEGPVIQGLTQFNASVVVELLNLVSVPAIQHGNVIEISSGMAGIDEACSGIRSFQASLMLSLFLGEFFRLLVCRRMALCLAGFALTVLFNVGRTFLLVYVSAAKGMSAIASWHDPAGVTILLTCFCGVWFLAVLMRGRGGVTNEAAAPGKAATTTHAAGRDHRDPIINDPSFPWSSHRVILWSIFILWLLLIKVGVELWYRWHEVGIPRQEQWTVDWPRGDIGFKDVPIPVKAQQNLRFDEGRSATWIRGGLKWQVMFFRWAPGRIAPSLARSHTPVTCLPAAGKNIEAMSDVKMIQVAGLNLPFRTYLYREAGRPVFVFYCLWEDRTIRQGFRPEGLSYENRFTAVREGRRHLGQRSIELVLWGAHDAAKATELLNRELPQLIRTDTHPQTDGTNNGRG